MAPSSKLEATRCVREEVHIEGLAEVDTEACYRAMDFLLESLPELQEIVFFTVANLLVFDYPADPGSDSAYVLGA